LYVESIGNLFIYFLVFLVLTYIFRKDVFSKLQPMVVSFLQKRKSFTKKEP